jgi:hypothetical protein
MLAPQLYRTSSHNLRDLKPRKDIDDGFPRQHDCACASVWNSRVCGPIKGKGGIMIDDSNDHLPSLPLLAFENHR